MGNRTSTPISIIYSETKLLPLVGRFKFLNYKFLLRYIMKEDCQLMNLEDISALAKHYMRTTSTHVSKFEIVSPYANFFIKHQFLNATK